MLLHLEMMEIYYQAPFVEHVEELYFNSAVKTGSAFKGNWT